MKDLKPAKNVIFRVTNLEDLKTVEASYNNCNEIQVEVANALTEIRKSRDTIIQCRNIIADAEEKISTNETNYASFSNTLASSQDRLVAEIADKIYDSIKLSDRKKIIKLLGESPSFRGKDLKAVLFEDVQKGFKTSFSTKEITLDKPNPIIGRVLVKDKMGKSPGEVKKKSASPKTKK